MIVIVSGGSKWRSVTEFEHDVVSHRELDLSLVRAARALTSGFLRTHARDVVDKSMTLQELCVAYAEAADDIRSAAVCVFEMMR